MLTKEFNKFGGTELRTKRQVSFYLMLLEWIKKKQGTSEKFSKEKWDLAFKKWVKQEEIYSYANDKIIPFRFSFIISILKKIGISFSDGRFNVPKHIDAHTIFNKMINYENKCGVKPFKALLDFAIANPTKTNARKMILAFFVYDGKETFSELYNMDVVSELASREEDLPKFKKPPQEKKYIERIARKLRASQLVDLDDLVGYESLTQKAYIKRVFFRKYEKFNLFVLISRINNCTYDKFIYQIHRTKIEVLLRKDYFDLFSRWLYDFKLIDTSGTKAKIFYNAKLEKVDGSYEIKSNNAPKYPFSFFETIKYIHEIARGDFSFKNNHEDLKKIGNSILAEYFVNLFCCFQFNIKPSDFTSHVKTKVTDDLLPIFTAPGGKPDMSYSLFNDFVVNVETTILKTENQIQNKEIFSTTRHLVEAIENKHFNQSYLIFVSPLDPKVYEADFELVFSKKVPRGKLIMHSFYDLVHFDFRQITNLGG